MNDAADDKPNERDWNDVPLEAIEEPTQVLPSRWSGNYRAIKCVAKIPVRTLVGFGIAGTGHIRVGKNPAPFESLGQIVGRTPKGHLRTALWLPADLHTEILIIFRPITKNSEAFLSLICSTEFDTIVDGLAKDELFAWPRLEYAGPAEIQSFNRISTKSGNKYSKATTTLQIDANVEQKTASTTKGLQFDKVARIEKQSFIRVKASNDHATQVNMSLSVMPRPV